MNRVVLIGLGVAGAVALILVHATVLGDRGESFGKSRLRC